MRALALVLLVASCRAFRQTAAPTFAYRCRILRVHGNRGEKIVAGNVSWIWGSDKVTSNGTEWSEFAEFSKTDAEGWAKRSPNSNPKMAKQHFPALVTYVRPVTKSHEPTLGVNDSIWDVQLEVRLHNGNDVPLLLNASLFATYRRTVPTPVLLGVMLTLNTTAVSTPVQTMASFNSERYDEAFNDLNVTTPPRKFPIVDVIRGDNDLINWHGTVLQLSKLGITAIGTEPYTAVKRNMLALLGYNMTTGGIYKPPGAEPDDGGSHNSTSMASWAADVAAEFYAAGYEPQQMTAFALADEPGWYWPQVISKLGPLPLFHPVIA